MFNKLDKTKLAIIKIFNFTYINEKKYKHKDRFRNIILSQNLRIKFRKSLQAHSLLLHVHLLLFTDTPLSNMRR